MKWDIQHACLEMIGHLTVFKFFHNDSDKLYGSWGRKDRLKHLVLWSFSNNPVLHTSFKLCNLSIIAIKEERWYNICLHFRDQQWHEREC